MYSRELFLCRSDLPPPEPEDNAEGNTLSLQQSNNQAIQPQTFSLRDTIADRTN